MSAQILTRNGRPALELHPPWKHAISVPSRLLCFHHQFLALQVYGDEPRWLRVTEVLPLVHRSSLHKEVSSLQEPIFYRVKLYFDLALKEDAVVNGDLFWYSAWVRGINDASGL